MSAHYARWHRRLSVVAGVSLLIWAGSGLLHPLMSWTNPRPAAMAPPLGERLSAVPRPLAEILAEQDVPTVGFARLLVQDGETLWQWASPDRQEWRYANAADGSPRPQADVRRAEWLARYYSGEAVAAVAELEHITAFNTGYPSVNRLLPVWKVRFERADGLTAYVHTGEDRLGALNDRRKTVLLMLFQSLHTLHWLDGLEVLRVPLIAAAVLSVLAMTMLGLLMSGTRRARVDAPPLRRAHRRLAWIVWVPALMLGGSGLFHLMAQSPLRKALPPTAAAVLAAAVRMPAVSGTLDRATLIVLPGGLALWRLPDGDDNRWIDATGGSGLALEEGVVAARLAGLPDGTPAAPQTGFSDEYGFANKRLPVWRLEQGNGRVFVDLASGQIAARVSAVDVLEQQSFSALHKWQFLDPIGRGPRDALLALSALALLVMTGIGLKLRGARRTSH